MTPHTTSRIAYFSPALHTDIPSEEFGNKAYGLGVMSSLGIPVPPGFALHVSVCEDYYRDGMQEPHYLPDLLRDGIAFLEQSTGLVYGSGKKPLLVSVRSGAHISMPGIMDTILNVGLNRETLRGLVSLTGNPRFAWDSYRRLFENISEIVFHHDPAAYQALLSETMADEGISDVVELDSSSLSKIADSYQRLFMATEKHAFPEDVHTQLRLSASAVLRSWTNPRADSFRRLNPDRNTRGTAVTVQAMVFGNMGLDSGAGVAFTRNPWNGENVPVVDFKFGAQGEDVVSGAQSATTQNDLCRSMPQVYAELVQTGKTLEEHFADMQDLEFTVQEGRLFILQSRNGKRSPLSALRIAVDMWREGIISAETALSHLEGLDIESIRVESVSTEDYPIATGISASGGVATGSVVFTPEQAVRYSAHGPVILVRETASPGDIDGIRVASALLTARGTRTSHAAVVARQLGKVCIVNCRGLEPDPVHPRCHLGGQIFRVGDTITLDGDSGQVYAGVVSTTYEQPLDLLDIVRSWKSG